MKKADTRRSLGATADDRPRLTSSDEVYKGKLVTMRVDEVVLSNDRPATRVVVEHPGAVVIIAVDDDRSVYLVRQYRYAIGHSLLELPAGTLEPREDALEAAKRELREEVGASADEWSYLGSFYTSPGFVNEELHVFLAQGVVLGESQPDYDEDLEVVRMPLAELLQRAAELQDAKSLAALCLLGRSRGNGTAS